MLCIKSKSGTESKNPECGISRYGKNQNNFAKIGTLGKYEDPLALKISLQLR
jgi:hypothetical protein